MAGLRIAGSHLRLDGFHQPHRRDGAGTWLAAFDRLQIREFRACTKMLRNWKKYILNAFDVSCSNGFTEDCKNTAKTLKRHAFGFHNFLHFRVCILWTVAAHPHICQRAPSALVFYGRLLPTLIFTKEAAKEPKEPNYAACGQARHADGTLYMQRYTNNDPPAKPGVFHMRAKP
ncbi:MAG: transposase [Eubacteriales bacterium]|nr:transposase [Eubacteriales bacterium]